MKTLKLVFALVISILMSFTTVSMAQENDSVSRIELSKSIIDAFKIELLEGGESSFNDIKAEDSQYINTIVEEKIASGYGESFKPNKAITNEEAMAMIVRAMGEEKFAQRMDIQGIEKGSDWAKGYIAYSMDKGIIDNSIDPNAVLTKANYDSMIKNAVEYYNTELKREGLTVYDMLDKASQNMLEKKTYKATTNTTSTSTIKSQEESEEDMVTNMSKVQEIQFEAPETVYVKDTTTMKNPETDEDMIMTSEVYMKDRIMYIKSDAQEKWIKMDMNPMMNELQSVMGSSMNTNTLTKEQLDVFGMYAKYEADEKIEDKDYYVVSIDIDNESFKEIVKMIADKATEIAANVEDIENKDKKDIDEFIDESGNQEMVKQIIDSLIENMQLEMKCKYYIDKETKMYDKMKMEMDMNMNFMGMNSETKSTAESKYYDFGEDVEFPEISEDDIESIEQ
ncbi:S-layer homology domain-containing protein [Tepidibacter aestuarii]|uniref:S-layer homology domain-containing protein n=1 Tax=Tepidibacter aestuarii TaxID=2925782 RepID=UPI0020C1066E|nr:S-layer homology domain-containing protein [Tepidibacter aestuarii]CAH2211992.1 S-layer homology domain-containing protein [Tepidibacter aestuarii]